MHPTAPQHYPYPMYDVYVGHENPSPPASHNINHNSVPSRNDPRLGADVSGYCGYSAAPIPAQATTEIPDHQHPGHHHLGNYAFSLRHSQTTMETNNTSFGRYSANGHGDASQAGPSSWEPSALQSEDLRPQQHTTSESMSPWNPAAFPHYFADAGSPATESVGSMPRTPEPCDPYGVPTMQEHDGSFSPASSPLGSSPIATRAVRMASDRRRKYAITCWCTVQGCGQGFTTAYSLKRKFWLYEFQISFCLLLCFDRTYDISSRH